MTLVSDPARRDQVDPPAPTAGESPVPTRGRVLAMRAAVVSVLAAGIALRFHASSPLWLDEAISVDVAQLPVGRIGSALRHDGHPPLYYLLLHGWTVLFGSGDVAVRSFSGVTSTATLPLMWVAGRRLGSRTTATVAVLLLASSPFAVRYATEARMYALCTFLALAGYLAVVRALEAPRPARLALVAAIAAAVLFTHYWGLWLVASGFALVAALGIRARTRRPAAIRVGGALAVGSLAFVAWLPSLLYQAGHTGTPWARSVEPLDAAFDTMLDFGGGKWPGGRLLGPLLVGLVLVALVARPIDRWRMVVDLRTVPGARVAVTLAAGTMALGLIAAVAVSSAYQPRYAAVIVAFVLLAATVGIGRLPHPAVTWGVIAIVIVGGLAGSLRWDLAPRTQAGQIASALQREARPGDVVGYCPDQLRPAVQRALDQRGGPALRAATYPEGSPRGRVDWVDYTDRISAADPDVFAARLLRLAGPEHTVWLVDSDGYRGFGTDCEEIRASLAKQRATSAPVVKRDAESYERDVLHQYPPR